MAWVTCEGGGEIHTGLERAEYIYLDLSLLREKKREEKNDTQRIRPRM